MHQVDTVRPYWLTLNQRATAVCVCVRERGARQRKPHLAQVGLRLAGELGHDLRPVDEEEERARLVGHGARDERLAGPRRPVQQDAFGRLDADGLEELRVAQRQLHQLADLRHLLANTTHVVVPHLQRQPRTQGQRVSVGAVPRSRAILCLPCQTQSDSRLSRRWASITVQCGCASPEPELSP